MAGPYGASVAGARNLALDVAAEGRRPDQVASRVGDQRVEAWLAQGGSLVSLQIPRFDRLPANPDVIAELGLTGVPDQETVATAARHLVELYAASMLADVTHPERARRSEGYGGVLYDRYESGLADLAAAVEAGVDRIADLDPVRPGAQYGGADGVFPLPQFTRTTGF